MQVYEDSASLLILVTLQRIPCGAALQRQLQEMFIHWSLDTRMFSSDEIIAPDAHGEGCINMILTDY